MTYEDMIQELLDCGEIEETETVNLVDYNGWPVSEEMLIDEIIGGSHNPDTNVATIIVVATDD